MKLSAIFLTTLSGINAVQECPEAFNLSTSDDRYCLRVFTDTKTWESAQTECENLNANLVTIRSQAVQDEINSLTSAQIWLGFKRDSSNEFKWISGDNVDFTNWGSNQPDNAGDVENCVEKNQEHQWNDISCNNGNNEYICEIKSDPICSSNDQVEFWTDANFVGSDFQEIKVDAQTDCMDLCLATATCVAFTYALNRETVNCWLKSEAGNYEIDSNGSDFISGMKCGYEPVSEPPGIPAGKYPETVCPVCWSTSEDGKCVPSEEAISLTCNSNSMDIKLDKCLTDKTQVTFLSPSCGSSANDTHLHLTTSLDSCGTFFESEDEQFQFSNYIIFETPTSPIYFGQADTESSSNLAKVKISCSYDNTLEISAGYGISTTSNDTGTTTTEGQGTFGFELTQTLSLGSNENIDQTTINNAGEYVSFSLNFTQPIDGFVFTIKECIVRDEILEREYAIINNQCSDNILDGQISALSSSEAIGFNYKGFQFTDIVGYESELEISCTVVACDENDQNSLCMVEPTCE